MSDLELKLVEKDKKIAELEEDNKLKNYKIKDLRKRIKDRDKEIEKLENWVSNRDEEIERKQAVIDSQWLPRNLIIADSMTYIVLLDVSSEIKADSKKDEDLEKFTRAIQFHRISNGYYERFERETIGGKNRPLLLKHGLFPNMFKFEQLANEICEYEFGDNNEEEDGNEEEDKVGIFLRKGHRFYFDKYAFYRFMKIFEDKVKAIPEFTYEE